MNAKELIAATERLFSKRLSLVSLWQELSENFYPERADFTVDRSLGDEFAGNLETSYPLLARRDLGNAIGTMLRPRGMAWFDLRTIRGNEPNDALRWLQWAPGLQRRAMYDRRAQFTRAVKEGDHDWACFGQAVISVQMNTDRDGLLYRNWHLRDVAWAENAEGAICTVHRKWKPTVRHLKTLYGDKISQQLKSREKKNLDDTVNCVHIVMPAEDYDLPAGEKRSKHKYVEIHLDVDNEHIMDWSPSARMIYVIPRWQTVSGSQYAYSPATVAALPEARLIQAMTGTLLEAGEKLTNPPMMATQEAVKSNIEMFAGGVTWVDRAYDERLGDALRPLTQDPRGFPFGLEMRGDVQAIISEAFFLSQIAMPQKSEEMTAYEVQQRVKEFIRRAGPLFDPMEAEYNGQVCDESFEVLMANGGFGSPDDMPQSLDRQEVRFQFQSPLRDAYEREKGQKFLESKQFLAHAAELDPTAAFVVDSVTALRDVLNNSVSAPATWIRPQEQAAKMAKEQKAKEEAMQLLEGLQGAGDATKAMGEGAAAMAEAGQQQAI